MNKNRTTKIVNKAFKELNPVWVPVWDLALHEEKNRDSVKLMVMPKSEHSERDINHTRFDQVPWYQQPSTNENWGEVQRNKEVYVDLKTGKEFDGRSPEVRLQKSVYLHLTNENMFNAWHENKEWRVGSGLYSSDQGLRIPQKTRGEPLSLAGRSSLQDRLPNPHQICRDTGAGYEGDDYYGESGCWFDSSAYQVKYPKKTGNDIFQEESNIFFNELFRKKKKGDTGPVFHLPKKRKSYHKKPQYSKQDYVIDKESWIWKSESGQSVQSVSEKPSNKRYEIVSSSRVLEKGNINARTKKKLIDRISSRHVPGSAKWEKQKFGTELKKSVSSLSDVRLL